MSPKRFAIHSKPLNAPKAPVGFTVVTVIEVDACLPMRSSLYAAAYIQEHLPTHTFVKMVELAP